MNEVENNEKIVRDYKKFMEIFWGQKMTNWTDLFIRFY